MLNPVHLRTLAAVVRYGSFADGARRLGYTGSAVSQQMASLERTLQVPLFEREAHGIRATPAAEFLADRAHQVLAGFGMLEQEMRGFADGRVGRLRVGSFPTASRWLLPESLASFRAAEPGVDIQLDEGEPAELIGLVRDGELDVALVYDYDLVPPRRPGGLSATALFDEHLVLLLAHDHPLVGHDEITFSRLAAETWVTSRDGTAGATCLERLCANAGFSPRVEVRSNDYGVIGEFVRCGLGIAIVPSLTQVVRTGVVVRTVADLGARRHVHALQRTVPTSPAAPKIIETFSRAARELAANVAEVELPSSRSTRP